MNLPKNCGTIFTLVTQKTQKAQKVQKAQIGVIAKNRPSDNLPNLRNKEKYLGDYTLLCTFSTGERCKVDFTPLLVYPAFEELRDKNEFVQFGLDQTIFWKNGADIAPERLYELGVAA